MTKKEENAPQGEGAIHDANQPSRQLSDEGQSIKVDLSNLTAYVGTKYVKAKPMTGEEYKEYSGKADGNGPGYLVIYKDGYKSWSPKTAFDEAYVPVDNLTWPLVEALLPKGIIAIRKCWFVADTPTQIITMQRPADISLDVVSMMSSLNDTAKEYVLDVVQQPLKYRGQLLLITIDGYATTFTPDGLDRIATDWVIKGLED